MDPLSWLLISWVVIGAFVYFIVQNVLPIFVPPVVHPLDQPAKQPAGRQEHQVHQVQAVHQSHQETSAGSAASGFSSWATAVGQAFTSATGVKTHQQGETCDWLNNLLTWLHKNIRHSPEVVNGWLRAMNDASNKMAPSMGCDVYFEELASAGGGDQSTFEQPHDKDAPRLSSVRSEFGPREHLTLRGNLVYPKVSMRLVASQKLPDRLIVSNYLATLRDLKGEAHVRIACIGDDVFLMLCFEGKPDVTITLENGDKNTVERVDPTLVDEIIKRCLSTAVTNVCLGKPQHLDGNVANGATMHGLDDLRYSHAVTMQERQRSVRLLLKVEKASKLGGGKIVNQPYVVVELDEPAQKHTTTLGLNAHPTWEEQFLFDLNERSEEILFEVYDRQPNPADEPRFLGLAIVGIEELRQTSNLSHTLALQARPYKDDVVSGTLNVEFIFLRQQYAEGRGGKRSQTKMTSDTLEARPLHIMTESMHSSPMVKSVSQYIQSPHADGLDEGRALQPGSADKRQGRRVVGTSSGSNVVTSKPPASPATVSVDRGRKRERSSFFDDLKQRLSFRKGRKKARAQSLEADINGRRGQNVDKGDQEQLRSASTPPSREASASRRPDHTPMTSDSEMSMTSNDSVFPQSQLVVEAMDNGVKKYYLVPTAVQRHPVGKKIIKSGKKLHIYNEHTFTAVKTRPGSNCSVCKAPVATAFRRKGYQCRDCGFVCHKRCHFKTESHCPFSKVSNLPIEYVRIS